MKKIISILLISSLLTTCNANENELNRLSRWKSNTTNFIKENKKKTITFCVAVAAISGSGCFFYKRKKQNTEERNLARTIIYDVFNKVLSKRDKIAKAQEALNAAEEWLEEARNNNKYTRGIEILVASAKRFLQEAIEKNTDRMYEKPEELTEEELTANYQLSEEEKNINRIARKEFSENTVNDIINNVLSNKEQEAHQKQEEKLAVTTEAQTEETNEAAEANNDELSDTDIDIENTEIIEEVHLIRDPNLNVSNWTRNLLLSNGYDTLEKLRKDFDDPNSILNTKINSSPTGRFRNEITELLYEYEPSIPNNLK